MLHAQYIPGTAGRLFCTMHLPAGEPEEGGWPTVLVSPAFGDEMNKTRQTLAHIAVRLNEAGVAMLIPDLFGTGDSQGEFRDASWGQWLEDLKTVAAAAPRLALDLQAVLAIRTGALLAARAVSDLTSGELSASLWLQPVWNGEQFLAQFLRIRTVAKSVGEGDRETVDELRQRLTAGESINVAGYELTQHVAGPLAEMRLESLVGPPLGQIRAIEVSRLASKAGESVDDIGGSRVTRLSLFAEPYWSSTEIVVNEAVVAHGADHLLGHLAGRPA